MTVLWLVALAAVIVALVAGDVRSRTLDNRLVLLFTAVVGLAPFVHAADDAGLTKLLWSVGAGLLAFVLGLVLYQTGSIGAGDVKLAFGIAAVETWFGSNAWFVYLGCAIVAITVTLGLFLRRRQADEMADVPLGPALLFGVVPSIAAVLLAG